MTRRNTLIAAALGVIAIAAVPFVYAHGMRGYRGTGDDALFFMGHGFERAKNALDLSDDQVTQLKAIAQQLHDQNAPYRDQIRGGIASAAKALVANPNDLAGAQAILDQQAAARKAASSNMLAAASKALSVLTPEQRAKVGQFIERREARRMAR